VTAGGKGRRDDRQKIYALLFASIWNKYKICTTIFTRAVWLSAVYRMISNRHLIHSHSAEIRLAWWRKRSL